MLGIGALFLLFVLLYSQRVASQSGETLGELLHHHFLCCSFLHNDDNDNDEGCHG